MPLNLFFKGCFIGFSIAMPVGPIGLLCIRNSLAYGLWIGFLSGLGAACADMVYGIIAALGVSGLGFYLEKHQILLQVIGSLFLCYLGFMTFFAKPTENEQSSPLRGSLNTFISTFFLTLLNPLTILSFTGIFAGLAPFIPDHSWVYPLIVAGGVFIGSAIWWLILSCSASLLHARITINTKIWLNRISGMLLTGSGIVILFATFCDLI